MLSIVFKGYYLTFREQILIQSSGLPHVQTRSIYATHLILTTMTLYEGVDSYAKP